jgi:hypothetical protein
MVNETTIHAGFPDARTKTAREEKMITAFYIVPAEDLSPWYSQITSLSPVVRQFRIANQSIKACLGIA